MRIKVIIVFTFIFIGNLFSQWNTDRIILIGRNALYFEDYVLSIQYFNQVIKIKPYLSEPYMYRSIAKIQLGDFEGAYSDATISIDKNPFSPQALYTRGFALMRLERFKEASEDFSKALEFSPDSYHLLVSRMNALERLKDLSGALSDIETYLRLSPKTYQLQFEKGRILLEMKDTVAAEIAFGKYLEADSTSAEGWSARAFIRHQQNKLQEAYSDYSKAIDKKTEYYGDYINRGIINVAFKRYNQALEDYDNAIKLSPENLLAYYNRALLRANLGDDNNAYDDLKKVLKFDPNLMEARYSLALLTQKIGKYKESNQEYNYILKEYPYFIPALWGLASNFKEMGNEKESFRNRQKAVEIENNKELYKEKMKKAIEAKNLLAQDATKIKTNKNSEIFNQNITQTIDENSKYTDEKRGAIQNKFVDIVTERNFLLSYYSKEDELRRTNLFHPLVSNYNRKKVLSANLKITNQEIALTADLIDEHFNAINRATEAITYQPDNADLYFYRALEFALVKDFNSAIEDLNRSIMIRPDFVLAYFTRANIRYKLIEYLRSNVETEREPIILSNKDKSDKIIRDNLYKIEFEMIMRDYDKVIEIQPDFSFAYFNKANILASQQDFKSAIRFYDKSLEIESDFAEAVFNRGLTHLYIGQDEKGLADLSKAGELGLYSSYNLIQRFSKK